MAGKDATPQQAQEAGQGGVDKARPGLEIDHGQQRSPDPVAATDQPSALSNTEIALLCDIGEHKAISAAPELVAKLETGGYIQPVTQGGHQLTPMAQRFLLERGVGLNES